MNSLYLPYTLKISALLLLVESLLVGTLLYIGIANHEQFLHDDIKRESDTLATLLDISLAPSVMTQDMAQAQLQMEQILRKERLNYLLLEDDRGRVLASSGIISTAPLPEADRIPSLWLADGSYDFIAPIQLEGVLYGRIHVGMGLKRYQDLMEQWLSHSLLAAAVILLISLGLFLLFGQIFRRPLRNLTEASRRLADGHLGVRVVKKSQDEIGQLTDAFNSMSMRIEQQMGELRMRERRIDEERAFLQRVIDGVNDPIMVIDLDYHVLLENIAAKNHHGVVQGEKLCFRLTHKRDTPCNSLDHPCPVEQLKATLNPQLVIHEHKDQMGQSQLFEVMASPMLDASGNLTGIIESHRDITDRQKMQLAILDKDARIQHLVNHDQLTGLANRTLFNDRLEHALKSIERNDDMVSVVMFDLDRFKTFNESLGLSNGDRLLKQVAERLLGAMRGSDSVARIGSDEFAILLDRLKDLEGVMAALRKLSDIFLKPVIFNNEEYVFTVSTGVAVAPMDSRFALDLINCAEIALHQAKEQESGGQVRFYTSEMNRQINQQLQIESSLRNAVERREMRLFYQPQITLKDGQLQGFEALLRWQHPEKKLIGPDQFIHIAERTGYIIAIGRWVLKEACKQLNLWQQAGSPKLRMAVNLSTRQFRDASLVEMVGSVLQETGINPADLELEITESMIMENVDAAIAIMDELNRLGVRFSIDDFGTGYSSLSYLKRFPISTLKIDRTFIHDIVHDQNDSIISTAIISLGHNMGMRVIAEGVEDEEQAGILRQSGCDEAQGFLYGRPVDAKDINLDDGAYPQNGAVILTGSE
ncbi:MAG: EAL domain-containing protein [Candidatus Thiodiazotropha sp. 6PLUC2]